MGISLERYMIEMQHGIWVSRGRCGGEPLKTLKHAKQQGYIAWSLHEVPSH
jgi:hypothetical protein